MSEHKVVVAWGPGMYAFKYKWEARLFKFIARRWTSWMTWEYLTPEEKQLSLKPRIRKRIK